MGVSAQEFENFQRKNRLGAFAPTPNEERGLEARYEVHKINDPAGKHNECQYFVLDPQHDPIARETLRFYMREAGLAGFDQLHDDLLSWLSRLDNAR